MGFRGGGGTLRGTFEGDISDGVETPTHKEATPDE